MSVIVDTSVWSLALRRKTTDAQTPVINELRSLIDTNQARIIGAIRQEILSGVRHAEQFARLQNYLRAFPDLELTTVDYELAAEFFNTCRSNGIQGSNTDFLICAVAHRHDYRIFTTDQDFANFQNHIPLTLHSF
ncbi:MAG: type II toxin-antitoxin system VapC family toxin [Spirulinaceae cyanobacterium]